jgi:lipoprotein-releasing system permease protein
VKSGFEWFVAWRYLSEKGKRSSYVTFGIGLLIVATALGTFYVASHTRPLRVAEILAGAQDFRARAKLLATVALAIGVLVTVFGYLHIFQSVFTTISTFGVFLGTTALVIVLSVMNGFEVDLRKKILGSNAHVLVTKAEGAFTEWKAVEEALDQVPSVLAHSPYVSSEVVVAANSNYAGVIIKGIQPATAGLVTDLAKNLDKDTTLAKLLPQGEAAKVEPDPPPDPPEDEDDVPEDFSGEEPDAAMRLRDSPPKGGLWPPASQGLLTDLPREREAARVRALDGLLVGRELAKSLHLYQGEEVQVVSPLGQDTPAGQVPRTRAFRVAGTFYSGMYEYDTKSVYAAMPALQAFLSLGDEVTGIEVKVRHIDETAPVVRAIQAKLGPAFRIKDWKEINRNLFSALQLEKIVMFVVLAIIILVASFSIVSNLIMVVVEKAKEIAILKSMGASDGGVMSIFMIEGLYVGAIGTLFGLVVGVSSCWALGRFGLPLDPDVYYIDKLPVAMDPLAIAAVAVAGVLISFIATIYPSYVAARLRPVDGLRYE